MGAGVTHIGPPKRDVPAGRPTTWSPLESGFPCTTTTPVGNSALCAQGTKFGWKFVPFFGRAAIGRLVVLFARAQTQARFLVLPGIVVARTSKFIVVHNVTHCYSCASFPRLGNCQAPSCSPSPCRRQQQQQQQHHAHICDSFVRAKHLALGATKPEPVAATRA